MFGILTDFGRPIYINQFGSHNRDETLGGVTKTKFDKPH